jgi:hypothetical protein
MTVTKCQAFFRSSRLHARDVASGGSSADALGLSRSARREPLEAA